MQLVSQAVIADVIATGLALGADFVDVFIEKTQTENRKKIIKKVTFFLMEYAGQSNLKYYDSEIVIERDWYEFEQACEKLAYDSEIVLLKKAKNRLENLKPLSR